MRPFDLVNKIRVLNPHANIDELYGPYESFQEAISAIPLELRILGRTVGIITNDSIEEYWWKENVSDIGLILKISGNSTSTKTSELINDGEDGLNPFITIYNIATKAEVDASNLSFRDVISWRDALDIYSKTQVDVALNLKLNKPSAPNNVPTRVILADGSTKPLSEVSQDLLNNIKTLNFQLINGELIVQDGSEFQVQLVDNELIIN